MIELIPLSDSAPHPFPCVVRFRLSGVAAINAKNVVMAKVRKCGRDLPSPQSCVFHFHMYCVAVRIMTSIDLTMTVLQV